MVAILKKLARKISRFIYFILLLIFLCQIFPDAELYIDESFATKWALFVYGDESAESMYDAFTDIDFSIMLLIAITFYILTMKLIKKLRSK